MTECPRCGTQAQHLTKDHLERCGEASDGFPAGRWRARDYVGLGKDQQAEMRRIEVADVMRGGIPKAVPEARNGKA